MNTRSLRFRVTSWYAAMFAVSLLLFALAIYVGLNSYLDWTLRSSLRADAISIAERLVEEVPTRGDRHLVEEINEGFAPEVNSKFIRVTKSDGEVIYLSKPPIHGSFDPSLIQTVPTQKWLPSSHPFTRAQRSLGREPLMIYGLPYTTHDGERFLVEVGATYRQIRSTMDGLLLLFAVGLPAMVILAFVGGYSALGRALSPVREITNKAESISLTHPDQRLPIIPTGDELEQLSRALNRMLDRLDEAFQHIRQFSADVSHEMRTPLTIMRGELEAMVGKPQSPAQNMEIAGSCLEEVDRLTRIIDQLLVLSRLDMGDRLAMEVLELGELAKSTADQMHLLLEEKSQTLNYDFSPGVFVEGNPSRLRQVVVNLLANAIKYTPNEGTLWLAVGDVGETAYIEVADNGVGIPASDLPHVFDRFFRADRARSRQTGGAGLGLSIVKAIASAHGGRVDITSTEGTGTRVRFEIPRAQSLRTAAAEAGSEGVVESTMPQATVKQ